LKDATEIAGDLDRPSFCRPFAGPSRNQGVVAIASALETLPSAERTAFNVALVLVRLTNPDAAIGAISVHCSIPFDFKFQLL
jgi:hypothetical protein